VVCGYGVSRRLVGCGKGENANPTATKQPTCAAPMVRCISGTVTVDMDNVSQERGIENKPARCCGGFKSEDKSVVGMGKTEQECATFSAPRCDLVSIQKLSHMQFILLLGER
jgi:hypothetical protein